MTPGLRTGALWLHASLVVVACDSDSTNARFEHAGGAPGSAATGGAGASPNAASGGAVGASGGPGAPGASGSSGSVGIAGSAGKGSGGAPGVASGGSPSTGSKDASAPGGSAGSATDAGPSGGDSGAGVSTGTLPPVTDPGATGPFTPETTGNIGPGGNYTAIEPKELGKDGIKHPILIWGPGAGASPPIYKTLLDHIASHGFVVISYNTTPQGPELTSAIDWIEMESTRQGSTYFDKVDTKKIAAGGQSAGSLATFNAANDPRWVTTLHINGGTFAPHTAVANLVKPAQFICGDDPSVTGGDGTWTSDLARPNCDIDFQMATAPVWYGVVIGASHTTIIDNPLAGSSTPDPLKKPFLAATVAWLRWQLALDLTMKPLFVGANCGYCMQKSAWLVQQKNL